MAVINMKELLESGVHFGHRTHKWHPAMKPYIYTERNSIHIIDLQQTVKALEVAYNLIQDTVADGGTVLIVGTKRQAQETVMDEADRCGMPYVTTRWLGGMLTNFRTIRQRVTELESLERMRDQGEFERITKKEALNVTRRIERLEYLLGGIRDMTQLPQLLFVVDVRREDTAIHEANILDIPVVAMVDTNADPRNVDYIIPSNDDAIRAIKLLVSRVADAVLDGKAMRKDIEEEEVQPAGRAAMPGTEEKELTDADLLGEATLAKITASQEQEKLVKAEAEAELEAAEAEAETAEVETDIEESELEEVAEIEAEVVEAEVEEAVEVELEEAAEAEVIEEAEAEEVVDEEIESESEVEETEEESVE